MVTYSIVIRDESRKHFFTQKVDGGSVVELDDERIQITKDTHPSTQAQLVFARQGNSQKMGPKNVQPATPPFIDHNSVEIRVDKNNTSESIIGQGTYGTVKKCLLEGQIGYRVKVPRPRNGQRKLTQDDPGLLLAECKSGYALRHTDRFVHTMGLWVNAKGVGQGIVMKRYKTGLDKFISKLVQQSTQLTDGWQVAFLKWLTEEYVRAMLEAHRLGVTIGDNKLGNGGLSTCPYYTGEPVPEKPWIGQILQLCDLGLAGRDIRHGSFMHRPGDFTRDPARVLLEQPSDQGSGIVTLRRNDWFQVAMTILDAAHRVCGTWLNAPECWGLDSRDSTKQAARQIGSEWASIQNNPCSSKGDKRTGWLVFLVTHSSCDTYIPAEVKMLFTQEGLKDIDRRLTRNFQTSK